MALGTCCWSGCCCQQCPFCCRHSCCCYVLRNHLAGVSQWLSSCLDCWTVTCRTTVSSRTASNMIDMQCWQACGIQRCAVAAGHLGQQVPAIPNEGPWQNLGSGAHWEVFHGLLMSTTARHAVQHRHMQTACATGAGPVCLKELFVLSVSPTCLSHASHPSWSDLVCWHTLDVCMAGSIRTSVCASGILCSCQPGA